MIRQARYAGTWYPDTKDELNEYFNPADSRVDAIAAVCPHAGWIYSGKLAAEVYGRLKPRKRYILIGPNHHGAGPSAGVYPNGAWETPLGNLPVDKTLAEVIIKTVPAARADYDSHLEEHSLEVQMPFVKWLSPEAQIVPITLSDYRPAVCRSLGEAIAAAVKEQRLENETTLIASSDMSHYIPAADAEEIDRFALKRIEAMDPEGLLKTVQDREITMCGSGPVAAVLWAAKILGASAARLVRYTSSAETTGDDQEVVAYAGFVIT